MTTPSSPSLRRWGLHSLAGPTLLAGGLIAYTLLLWGSALLLPGAALLLLAIPPLLALLAGSPRDAATILSIFLGAQILLPAILVVGALGSVGRPALLVGFGAIVVVAWAFVGSPALKLPGRAPAIVAVLGLFLTSTLLSFVAAFTLDLLPIERRAVIRWTLFVVSLSGVTLLTAKGVDRQDRLVALLRRLVLFISIAAFTGIVHFVLDIDLARFIRLPGLVEHSEFIAAEARSDFQRVAGTAVHPIEFSVILAMTLPFAIHFAVFDPGRRRWTSYLQLGLIAVAVPMALSRSGVLCLALTVGVLVATWPMRLRLVAAVVTVAFLGVMRAVFPGLLGTLKALFVYVSVDPSTTGRTQDYAVVSEFLRENVWLGRGGYTFIPELYRVLDNQYLLTLVESGVVGLVALLSLFATGIALATKARSRAGDRVTGDLGQCVVAALVGAAATFATFDALSFPTVSALVFFLVGVAGAQWSLATADPAVSGRRPRRP